MSAPFSDYDAADAAQRLAALIKEDDASEADALYQRVRVSAFDRPGGIASWALAETARDRGDYAMAIYYFREACEKLLRSDKLVANSAAVAWQKLSTAHQDSAAEKEALRAVVAAAQPTFALWAASWLAQRTVKAGDYAGARAVLENAIETLPAGATAQAWLLVGQAYALESDLEQAESALQRAARLGDRDTALAARSMLGGLAQAAGDYPAAEAAFRAATEAEDRDVAVVGWASLGDAARARGNTQAAMEFWEKSLAVASEPGKHGTLILDDDELPHRTHFMLGITMIDADPADERARQHLSAVLAHHPCEHTALAGLTLGQAAAETGEPELALTSLGYAAEAADDETRAQANFLRGFACGMTGDLTEAEAAFRKAGSSGIQPWADMAQVNLAETFVERGRLTEARGLAEKMLNSQVDEVVAYAQYTLGQVRGRQGELTDALHWLGQAADSGFAATRVQALLARGELLSSHGDVAAARVTYAELLLEEDEDTVAQATRALENLDRESSGGSG